MSFFSFSTWFTQLRNTTGRGFGLVELLVAIGIMVLVTTVVVVRQNSFNSVVLLENQAYEVATDIRGVQVQAVSTQNINVGSGPESYRESLGVRLVEGAQRYDFVRGTPDGDLFGTGGRLDRRFEISEIIAYDSSGGTVDAGSAGIGVMFTRPNFDAEFYRLDNNNQITASSVHISVQSLEDGTRTRDIVVTTTGQVSVSNPNIP